MQSRLDRYERFIEKEYLPGLLKPDEYSMAGLTEGLRERLAANRFKRIAFTGMGCSAIVSDIVRGYFTELRLPVEVHVLNDYDFRFLAPASALDDETLYVVSSYSGHSTEPIIAFEALRGRPDQIMLLTSGGKLAELGAAAGVSTLYWRLSEPDREYPLFHVSQYFAILMDVFYRLGVLDSDHRDELARLAGILGDDLEAGGHELVESIAAAATDANIIMISSPKWHESLLKLCKMHLNEMAMVPATRNFFHEFCHSEVATLSDPDRRHCVIWLSDEDDDEYTIRKGENLRQLLSADVPQNRNVSMVRIHLGQEGFLHKYFAALNIVQRVALSLGRHHLTKSRDLISESAGNAWYHSTTIAAEGRHANSAR
ncbi:SIS domain-containing protein [Amycolatopsis sp. cmx-11-32]|uniref:SIS domain-containing protein n=1 Tax=Amycolatopsis sp. cmx-11-32 TaxID=2785796 RepID=UPI0039E5D947